MTIETEAVTAVDYSVLNPVFPLNGTATQAADGNFLILNEGDGDGTDTIFWTVRVSNDAVYQATDIQLDSGTATALSAGGISSQIDFSGFWPGSPGNYYLIIVLIV